MKRFFLLFALFLMFVAIPVQAASPSLATRFQGQILLQVQSRGEAWYVNPKDQKRYYMRDGAAAYQMMRSFGRGISEVDFAKADARNVALLNRLKGLIVLRVGLRGEAYYVNPKTLTLTYLKDGDAAYTLMREQGQGIGNSDIQKIDVGAVSGIVITPPSNPLNTVAPIVPVPPVPTVDQVAGVYCTTASGDCAGFKVKIDFDEDAATCNSGSHSCKYYSANTKKVYYLTMRSDILKGKVVLKNLDSGVESNYDDLLALGPYEPLTGKISFFYGYYRYPNIKEDFISTTHEGTITRDRFVGTYHRSGGSKGPTTGTITHLPITVEDKIPRKTCIIKGDTIFYSGGKRTYYTATSAAYSSINFLVEGWFCSEDDAINAGYQKALR